jgi:aryl-alcohol dehydrogenase-like predicted oxidoreductase
LPCCRFVIRKKQNNLRIRRISKATAGLGGVWGNADEQTSVDTILKALELGIAVLDTAPAYSHAENFVGKALQPWQGASPFISTKIGRLKSEKEDVGIYDYSAQSLERSLENSLRVLGLHTLEGLLNSLLTRLCLSIPQLKIFSLRNKLKRGIQLS